MAQTELSKQIKRINERYNAIARSGYINSEEFETYTNIIAKLPHHRLTVQMYNPIDNTYTPKTILAISNVKPDQFTPQMLKQLNRLSSNKKLSVGSIHKNARKLLIESGDKKPTMSQVREMAFKGSSVHEWIKTYKFAIYGYVNQLGEHSLYDALKRSSRLTADEVNEMFNEVVNASVEKRNELRDNYIRNNKDFQN